MVVVINITRDVFWLAQVRSDPAHPEGGHWSWETLASGEEGLLGPGVNSIRVEAVAGETTLGADQITIVAEW